MGNESAMEAQVYVLLSSLPPTPPPSHSSSVTLAIAAILKISCAGKPIQTL